MKYKPRLPPMQHQTTAIAACRRKPRTPVPTDAFAYLMDMGTGKSKVVLDEFFEDALNGGPLDLLIVAPAGSYRNWFADKGDRPDDWSELRKHVPIDVLRRTAVHGWRGGKTETEKKELERFLALTDDRFLRVLIVNVEGLSTVDRLEKLCVEFLSQRTSRMVIDESTTIKSPSSSRTKVCWDLGALAQSRRILSGLWTPKGPLDLYAQCMFLDWRILGQKNFFTFKMRYAEMIKRSLPGRGRPFWQIVGYKNIEELQRRVAPYSFRVLKSDCLDLEPKNYTSIDVDLTPEQQRMIKEIKLFGNASISGTDRFVTTDMIIKQIARVSQIACGFVIDDEERVLHEVPELRTEAMMGVLTSHTGKAIIWTPWRPSLERVVSAIRMGFGPQAVAQWHGGNKGTAPTRSGAFWVTRAAASWWPRRARACAATRGRSPIW